MILKKECKRGRIKTYFIATLVTLHGFDRKIGTLINEIE